MSTERDAARFLPERGDSVAAVFLWPEGMSDTIVLPHEGQWIYGLPLQEITRSQGTIVDTIVFRFIRFSNGVPQPEPHDVRAVARNDVIERKPLFHFGEQWDDRSETTIRFTVDMRNQIVLGFFRPEAGDQVAVAGSFCDVCEVGFVLEAERPGIYSGDVPVRYRSGEPIGYQFRFVSPRRLLFPGSPWERVPERRLMVDAESAAAPYAVFNNQQRAVRFEIDSRSLSKGGLFDPLHGDILQIRLLLDGRPVLSDALVEVAPGTHETGVMIPLTAAKVEWQLVRNLRTYLSQLQEIEVGIEGRVVTG